MSATYRITRSAVRLLGRGRILRFHLFWSWLFARLALELAQDEFGHSFRDQVMGVTDEMLRTHCSGAVVVDVGCGMGRLSQRVAPWAHSVIGVDHDPVNLGIARRATTAENVTYRLADATVGLPEASGVDRADVVLAVHVLEHIDDAESFLREQLAFTSTVIVEVPDFAADPLNAVRWNQGIRWYSDADHVREYTLDSLSALFDSAGWAIDTVIRRGGTIAAVLHPKDTR